MATSGSIDFSQDLDSIVVDAFDMLGVYGVTDTIPTEEKNKGYRYLNRLFKSWQQQKTPPLWLMTEGVVFLDRSTNYQLYSSGAHSCKLSDFVSSTLSAAEAAGQTVLSITSTTNMTASDKIGIELDDGTRQWTTIVSVDSTTQVTVTAALTGAAASGNTVYTYTTKLDRPLRIKSVRRLNSSGLDKEVLPYSRTDYFNLAVKTTRSDVSYYYYDPQLTIGYLYVYPVNNDIDDILRITYHRVIEDFDSGSNTPDAPQEWYDAIVKGLAAAMSSTYGVQNRDELIQDAAIAYRLAYGFDQEDGNVEAQPDFD